jgi:glycosyltransferase involved in cell wall biosynthesis
VRVLHCIPSMEGGGAERQLTYLAAEHSRSGEEVHVALVSRGPNWTRLVASGATIHQLSARGTHDPALFRQLFKIMQLADPDVVQVWLRQMDIIGGLAALMLRKPLIITERAAEAAYPRGLKHTLRSFIGRFATAVISNSEEGDRYWRSRVNPRTVRYVIPNAVPVNEIALALPTEHATADGRKLVLFAGRLEPEKNIDTLLDVLRLTLPADDFNVVWCGVGTLGTRIEQWIERNGLKDRVKLIGYTQDLWSFMKRASVLVSPSIFEGSPNVVLEAMACRCPLLVSDIPQHRALLDESTAVLVDAKSAAQFAAAIRDILRDAEAARNRAETAFARVQLFSSATIGQQYMDAYRSVLAHHATVVRRASA